MAFLQYNLSPNPTTQAGIIKFLADFYIVFGDCFQRY